MEKIDPKITEKVRDHLLSMGYDSLGNYIVPGLVSTLVGEGKTGATKVRLFRNTRTQDAHITPHSHRFDLACMVIQGSVANTVFIPVAYPGHTSEEYSDLFQVGRLDYAGAPGHYGRSDHSIQRFGRHTNEYQAGQWYFLSADQIHSIKFSKDAIVLIFEGDSQTDSTVILEPHVDGRTIRTFHVEDWMFQP